MEWPVRPSRCALTRPGSRPPMPRRTLHRRAASEPPLADLCRNSVSGSTAPVFVVPRSQLHRTEPVPPYGPARIVHANCPSGMRYLSSDSSLRTWRARTPSTETRDPPTNGSDRRNMLMPSPNSSPSLTRRATARAVRFRHGTAAHEQTSVSLLVRRLPQPVERDSSMAAAAGTYPRSGKYIVPGASTPQSHRRYFLGLARSEKARMIHVHDRGKNIPTGAGSSSLWWNTLFGERLVDFALAASQSRVRVTGLSRNARSCSTSMSTMR